MLISSDGFLSYGAPRAARCKRGSRGLFHSKGTFLGSQHKHRFS